MKVDSLFFFICFLILLSPVIAELTPEDRIYLDQQFQKSEARTSSKIDTQINRIEKNLKKAVDEAKNDISVHVASEIKKILKSVVIGLSGMIIVTLGVFKIIDFQINHTRNIKKYEHQLKKDKAELETLIKENRQYRAKLDEYRKMVVKGQFQPQIQPKPLAIGLPIPTPQPKERWLTKKKIIIFVIIFIAFLIVAYLSKPYIVETFFNKTNITG